MGRLKHGRKLEGEELAFVKAHGKLLVESLKPCRNFAEAVEDFRKLEAEFVERAGDDEFDVTETRRRIAETILLLAQDKHPPFEACRDAWNDLVRLGFSGIDIECNTSWRYADCCAYDERPDEGLAVLEPLLAKLERQFQDARGAGAEYPAHFYEHEIEQLANLRDALLAQKRGEVVPWLETRRADEAQQSTPPTPEEEQEDALWDEFASARRAVYNTFAKSKGRSFADVAADYRRVEAEFTARAGEGKAFEECVRDMRAATAESIFMAAEMLGAPFAAWREGWDALVRSGFISDGKGWVHRGMYVEICLASNEPEAGLAVVEPWIAEIEGQLQEPKKPLQPPGHTRAELGRKLEELHELRDKLMAKRRGGEPST
ncbi:hypothetical protein [Polyangium jinanense]|uniref:Uncharacterized protein n=1 Tax=Polyangium jinanense TaxID=2829994 RepID=A0A9X4ANY6_9BACT|nr:hypothetical protein [Polyangium jinanense]MDC3953461.1 hypothetical protein [Polyangium jinanense]MDC3979418.1 hypothetical protein [Polyangium jinanense]